MIQWIVDNTYSIKRPQGRKTNLNSPTVDRGKENRKEKTASSQWRGREKTETNLSASAGAMLLTVC